MAAICRPVSDHFVYPIVLLRHADVGRIIRVKLYLKVTRTCVHCRVLVGESRDSAELYMSDIVRTFLVLFEVAPNLKVNVGAFYNLCRVAGN